MWLDAELVIEPHIYRNITIALANEITVTKERMFHGRGTPEPITRTISIPYRFYHACARDGHLPRALSLCLPSRSTPIVAIIFNVSCHGFVPIFNVSCPGFVPLLSNLWILFKTIFWISVCTVSNFE